MIECRERVQLNKEELIKKIKPILREITSTATSTIHPQYHRTAIQSTELCGERAGEGNILIKTDLLITEKAVKL